MWDYFITFIFGCIVGYGIRNEILRQKGIDYERLENEHDDILIRFKKHREEMKKMGLEPLGGGIFKEKQNRERNKNNKRSPSDST